MKNHRKKKSQLGPSHHAEFVQHAMKSIYYTNDIVHRIVLHGAVKVMANHIGKS